MNWWNKSIQKKLEWLWHTKSKLHDPVIQLLTWDFLSHFLFPVKCHLAALSRQWYPTFVLTLATSSSWLSTPVSWFGSHIQSAKRKAEIATVGTFTELCRLPQTIPVSILPCGCLVPQHSNPWKTEKQGTPTDHQHLMV